MLNIILTKNMIIEMQQITVKRASGGVTASLKDWWSQQHLRIYILIKIKKGHLNGNRCLSVYKALEEKALGRCQIYHINSRKSQTKVNIKDRRKQNYFYRNSEKHLTNAFLVTCHVKTAKAIKVSRLRIKSNPTLPIQTMKRF